MLEFFYLPRELELIAREALNENIDIPSAWLSWRQSSVIEPLRHCAQELLKKMRHVKGENEVN